MYRALLLSTACVSLALGVASCSAEDAKDSDTAGTGATGGSGGTSSAGTGSPTAGKASGGSGTAGNGTGGNATGGNPSGGNSTSGSAGVSAGTSSGGSAGAGTSGSAGAGPAAGQGGTDQGGGAGTGSGAAGGSETAGTGGSGTAGTGGVVTVVEPEFVSSAQGAYWTEGTLTETDSGNAEVTVNDSSMGIWDGFGGSFSEQGWDVLQLLEATERERAMQLLFGLDGARFAFGRVPIGANDYALERYTLNENAGDYTMEMFSVDHDKANIIPYVQAALAIKPDIRLWASPWTPPTWMKTNNAFDGGSMKDDAQTLQAHALYLAKFVEEYGKLGIHIEAIHPQNEPNYETRYPSCIWSAALYTKFIKDYLGPTFMSRNVDADIYLGTMSNADSGKDGTIISTVTGDSGAMAFIKGFGLQWNMINSVGGLKSKNLPIVQTEHKCGNYPWETATFNPDKPPNDHAYGVESWGLIKDWINAGATSYSAWNMVLDTNGKNSDMQRPWPQNALLIVDRAQRKLTVTPAYYVFRHLSEFVDPGATRLGTTGGNALAFKNPDGTFVAVLYNSGGAKQSVVAMGGKKYQVSLPNNGWATLNVK